MLTTDARLLAADPAEISDRLLDSGLTGVKLERGDAGLTITAAQGDGAIETAMTGWSPTSTLDQDSARSDYRGRLPAEYAAHVAHLRDFRNGIRAGTLTPTNAQRDHVIADLIDAIRLLVRSDAG